MSLTNAQIGKAVFAFLAVLACIALILAVATMPRPANGAEMPQKKDPPLSEMPCQPYAVIVKLFTDAGWTVSTFDVPDGYEADALVVLRTPYGYSIAVPMVDGCVMSPGMGVAVPLGYGRPPVDGTPA